MNDTILGWSVAGAVAVVMIATVAVVVVRAGRNSKAPGDSWERSEERRRRKEVIYGGASYVLLFVCAAVAAALSFHGLVGFGTQNLGLSGGWEYLVPFGLDGAAMFCSVLAVREASHGDAAMGSRCLVWLFAAASAWFNWVHAPRGVDHNGAPQFFAGMSLSAAVLFDRALKQTRKAALREQGLVPRPLPQIRIVRWLRAPRETFDAWSLMLLEGVRSLDEAVDEVRENKRTENENRERARSASRRERAQLKALSRQHRFFGRPGGTQLPALTPGTGAESVGLPGERSRESEALSMEPAIGGSTEAADSALSAPARAALVRLREERREQDTAAEPPSGGGTFDLTAEDDTQTLPRLDSLERKLQDLERLYG